MPERPRHTVAILGAGIGRQHAEALLALPDRFHLATICDLDAGRAQDLADSGEGCRVATEIDAVLADGAIDIVAICLPPHLHAPIAVRALEAGKAVVCEKPLATSLVDADAMLDAARRTGQVLAPVFQYRYGLGLRQLRHLIAQGLAGRPLVATLETHWNRDADYYAVPWRGTWAGEGGGAILSHAIHAHDLLTHVLGPVSMVGAVLATRANPIEVDDCAAISFTLADGSVATSSITLGAADDTSRLRFCFAGLTAQSGLAPYHPAAAPWTFTARAPVDQETIDRAAAEVAPEPEGYRGFYAELDRHLRGEPSEIVSAEDGRRSIELVTALYRAARTGGTVTLPLDRTANDADGWNPEVTG